MVTTLACPMQITQASQWHPFIKCVSRKRMAEQVRKYSLFHTCSFRYLSDDILQAFFFTPWCGARRERNTGPDRRSPRYCSRNSIALAPRKTILSLSPLPSTRIHSSLMSMSSILIWATSLTLQPVAKNTSKIALSRTSEPQAIRSFSTSLAVSACLTVFVYSMGLHSHHWVPFGRYPLLTGM